MSEKETEKKHEVSHRKKKSYVKKVRENPWIISSVVLAVLVIIMLVSSFGSTGKIVSESKAVENLIGFLNEQTGGGVEFVSAEDAGLLYMVTVSYNGQNIPVYVTKDGKYYVQGVAELDVSSSGTDPNTNNQNIPKSDKPVVELFVMSHCPYGTQAEKGILPAAKLLGDSIDFNIRFVYYAMHPSQGEVEEQLRQYCIQKEQKSVFNDYLECFLEEGDSAGCLVSEGVDQGMLDSCYAAADAEFSVSANKADTSNWLSGRYPLFDVDKDLNEQYGIGGSPTLVINGETVSSGRSPAAMLAAICSSFTDGNVPAACDTELPTDSYQPGFGWTLSTGQTTNGAQCS